EATLHRLQLQHAVEDHRRAAQGRFGFEEWDHVQDRGCSAASKVGEAVHAGNVRCIAGEADDESPRGFGAEPFLKPRHRTENVENICSGGELRAVLAYLELGEVKAKRLR